MNNVKTTIKGKKLIIEIDLSQDFGLSKSGKSISIASSLGNKKINEDTFLGINVYKQVKNGVTN